MSDNIRYTNVPMQQTPAANEVDRLHERISVLEALITEELRVRLSALERVLDLPADCPTMPFWQRNGGK